MCYNIYRACTWKDICKRHYMPPTTYIRHIFMTKHKKLIDMEVPRTTKMLTKKCTVNTLPLILKLCLGYTYFVSASIHCTCIFIFMHKK